ncbi:MAG: hypothetical protein RR495_06545 [Anaerovoracaceae bacterium]
MNENNIKQMVEDIKEELKDLKSKGDLNEVEYGEVIGLTTALGIIQSACFGYDLSKIDLDFDIDKKYLNKKK